MRAGRAAPALAAIALGACSATPTVHGYAGEKGLGAGDGVPAPSSKQ